MANPNQSKQGAPQGASQMPILDKNIAKNLEPVEPVEAAPEVKAPVVKSSGAIKVIALRDGLTSNVRVKRGEEFTIPGEHKMAKWMKRI